MTTPDPETAARAAYDAAVSAELRRLEAVPEFTRYLAKRQRTILALASADCDPLTTRESIWKRKDVVRKQTWFDPRNNWSAHPLMMSVLENVTRLTREFEEGKTLRKLEAQRAAHNGTMLELSVDMVRKARAMLDFPLARQVLDGGVTIIEPANWNMSNVASLANSADKLSRLALDMTTGSTKMDVTSGGEKLKGYAIVSPADWDDGDE